MINSLIKVIKVLRGAEEWLQRPGFYVTGKLVELLYFVFLQFGLLLIHSVVFLVSIPVHVARHPAASFVLLAARKPSGEFIDSYYRHYWRYQIAVASVLMFVVVTALQLYVVGVSYYSVGRPEPAQAYTTTIDLTPTWDDSAVKSDFYSFSCTPSTSYSCYSSIVSNTRLIYGRDQADSDCAGNEYVDSFYRTAIKFPTANIVDGATVTKVELIAQVEDAVNENVVIKHTSSDAPDAWGCNGSSTMFDNTAGGTTYVSPIWNSTGLKTVDLGGTAVTDVQARLTAGSNLGLSLTTSEPAATLAIGQIDSMEGAPDPILRVTYTLPPQAPTAATPNHSANTTTSITWNWIDQATEDSSGSNSQRIVSGVTIMCSTTGDMATTGATKSCQETGLSANTSYTRRANTVDPQGNTDGPDMSAFTSIESPNASSFSGVSTTSITVASSATLSNLSTPSSGVWFQESVSSTNSGWLTQNSWTKSGLNANTQYSFQAKARNGDTDETSLSSAATKYTLSTAPNVASTRSTSTWYTTNTFPFTNAAGWGGGGVQYYRYVWNQIATHTFTGSESTWSSVTGNCPGGTCTTANATLSQTATADANNWYLHAQSFNGEDVANGSGTNYGPYFFDGTGPAAPSTVNDGTAADIDSQSSTSEISANWAASSESGSGIEKYQYAIGTSSGGQEIVSFTDNGLATSVTRSGLALSNGTTYYVSVRAVDNAGNTGLAASSDGVTVNTPAPTMTLITNVQATVLSSTSVRITWTTNEPATSKVRYGLTTAYGSEVSDATLVTAHSMTLTNLQPDTTYHYEVLSTGSTSDSDADATFTTLAIADRLPTPTPVLPMVDQLVLTSRPLFTGNALSGNTMFLFVDGMLDSVFKASQDPSGVGSYAYRLRHDLGFGYHTFYVLARDDASGMKSGYSTARRFITFPDVPATIFDPVRDAVVEGTHVTVTGVAWSEYDVFVFIDQELAGVVKASVGRGGVGDFAFVSGELEPGEHTLHVRMRDQNGTIGLASTLRTFTTSSGP